MSKLELGAFSISLSVKDLEVSGEFYQKLGFEVLQKGENHLIMINGITVIGLFEGMFEGNILTFNPGFLTRPSLEGERMDNQDTDQFMDVRAIQKHLKDQGLQLISEVEETENPHGPGSIILLDPDGNTILVDQFLHHPEVT